MSDRQPMTLSGKAKLEGELKTLLQSERPSVIKAIEEARAAHKHTVRSSNRRKREGRSGHRLGEREVDVVTDRCLVGFGNHREAECGAVALSRRDHGGNVVVAQRFEDNVTAGQRDRIDPVHFFFATLGGV